MRQAPPVEAFVRSGFHRRDYFPHDVVVLAKQYPDTFLQLERRGVPRHAILDGMCSQVNVYARDLDGLPAELLADRAVNWHQQQLGRPGLIAAAGLFQDGNRAFVTLMQSDLCQQLFRGGALGRACKTRVESRFGRWYKMLMNAILDVALEHDVDTLYVPTSRQILSGVRKAVRPDLFVRVYDGLARRYLCGPTRVGDAEYWGIPLAPNRDRVVRLTPAAGRVAQSAIPAGPTICVFHDVEEDVHAPVSRAECRDALRWMLDMEVERSIRVTYNVVGTLWPGVRDAVAAGGHGLGFHSYNHCLEEDGQLGRARAVDLQVRGYRPPQSILTAELDDYALSYHNFEWLMSSARVFGFADVRLENGIVKIPVHLDDYALHTGEVDYSDWLERLRALLTRRRFVAVGLHDCYARHWIDRYGALLDELRRSGELRTADEIADATFTRSAAMHPPVAAPSR